MDLLSVLIAGFATGSAYALIALGIVIIFRSTDTVNFAIADIAVISMYLAYAAMSNGVPVVGGFAIAFVAATMMGVMTEVLLIRPLGHGREVVFIGVVVTIGLSLLIQAVIGWAWGHIPFKFVPLLDGTVHLGPITIALNKLLAIGVALVLMLLVAWFFAATFAGVSMRASAEDPYAAEMIGLNSRLGAILGWGMGCGLACIGMFFLAADTSLYSTMAAQPLFRAFAGAFLGGLTSMTGAVAGGFIIGILDTVAARYFSSNYIDTIVFSIIILVLFLRPSGMFGALRKDRV